MNAEDNHIICRDCINAEKLIVKIKNICQTGLMQLGMEYTINVE